MKRWRMLATFVAVFALVAAACGDDDDTAADETTTTTAAAEETTTTTAAAEETTTTTAAALPALKIWADDKFGPIIEQLAVPFTEETSVPVEVTVIDFQDMGEQINLAAPAGEGPDVFILSHDAVGGLVANGIAAPIDLGAKAGSFSDVSKNALTVDGNLYAVPYAQEAIGMFYNADLVPEPPASLAELTALCDELGAAITNCLGVQGGGVNADAFHNFPFVGTKGGYIFGFTPETGFDVTDVGLDSEGAVASMEVLDGLVQAGYVAAIDEDDAKQLFIDGQQPFFMSGPWWINTWNEEGLNWGATALPTMEGDPMVPFVGVRGFYISEFGESKAVAEEFVLNFIATDEGMTALHEADPRGPAWIPTLEALPADDDTIPFAESASNGLFMPNVPEMGEVWVPLGNQILAVRQGEKTPAAAMADAAEQVRAAVAG